MSNDSASVEHRHQWVRIPGEDFEDPSRVVCDSCPAERCRVCQEPVRHGQPHPGCQDSGE